jgi:2-dehydro-3-deoxyphosphogluconate aldolase/(4S)-4-hydroxy-2-oxoglutarate aldolase
MTAPRERRELSERLRCSRIITVLRAPSVEQLYPACDVLVEQGILSLEFTLTTPGLLKALPALVDRYGSAADVGVGTVTTAAQADEAIDYDVDYLVTPTVNEPVVTLAVRRGVAVFPGGLTPSELAAGWDAGATAVKVFPAQT